MSMIVTSLICPEMYAMAKIANGEPGENDEFGDNSPKMQ